MKKIMFGLLVAATAVSVSAFTNAKSARAIESDHMVQLGANNFEQREEVDVDNCTTAPVSRRCLFDVTSSGKANIPEKASYSDSDIDSYTSNGWITPNTSSSLGLYVD